MMNPAGTGVRRVIEGVAFDQSIAWSPDGEHLAFVRYDMEGEGGSRIDVGNADGSDVTTVTSQAGVCRST
jgi:Tol biopolymer transport system component